MRSKVKTQKAKVEVKNKKSREGCLRVRPSYGGPLFLPLAKEPAPGPYLDPGGDLRGIFLLVNLSFLFGIIYLKFV